MPLRFKIDKDNVYIFKPVMNVSDLPPVAPDGAICVVLSQDQIYEFDANTMKWRVAGTSESMIGGTGGPAKKNIRTDYIYNEDGELVQVITTGDINSNVTYYYENGRISKVVEEAYGYTATTNYYYDDNGRLIYTDGSVITDQGETQKTIFPFSNVYEVTITHNRNSDFVIVQCYDENKKMFIPQEVQILDSNTVKVIFGVRSSGTVVII